METMSSFEFYQKKHKLKPGKYIVIEHDETKNIAIINDCECLCIKWIPEYDFIESYND